MAVESLLICLIVGLVTGWAGHSLIGGNRMVTLVTYVIGAFIGGIFIPRVGIFISSGIIGETINALLGAVLLSLPLNVVLRDKAANEKRVPRPTRNFSAFSPLRSRTKEPQSPAIHNKIFISYRRDDSRDVTGRIYDRLIRDFGEGRIFRDIDSLPIGLDFRKHVDERLSNCDVCLVVIGDGWLKITDGKGQRRIDDPRDHVRIEIETALRRTIPVVPVLVGGASMPTVEELPEGLQDLAFRNGVSVRGDPDFHRDVDRLVSGLKA